MLLPSGGARWIVSSKIAIEEGRFDVDLVASMIKMVDDGQDKHGSKSLCATAAESCLESIPSLLLPFERRTQLGYSGICAVFLSHQIPGRIFVTVNGSSVLSREAERVVAGGHSTAPPSPSRRSLENAPTCQLEACCKSHAAGDSLVGS